MPSVPTQPQPGLAPLTLSPLQPSTAHLLSLVFACCYVGSLYISNRARLKFETNLPARRRPKARRHPKKDDDDEDTELEEDDDEDNDEREEDVQERAKLAHERWRDDPDVIVARLTMASLASLVCVVGVGVIVYIQNDADSSRLVEVVALTANYLGAWSPSMSSMFDESAKFITGCGQWIFTTSLNLLSSLVYISHPQFWTTAFSVLGSLSSASSLERHNALDEICQALFSNPCTPSSASATGSLHSLWSMVQAAWYTGRPHVVLPLLFLGPLLATYLDETLPFQRRWSWRYAKWRFGSWVGLRTYILGPITEEIVFRACTLAVSNMAHLSKKAMVLWTPLVFGVAHVHHAWDAFNRYGRTKRALKVALISTLLQFCYTSLFGFLVAYLFINSGSLYPPITAHMFCNVMGLPSPIEEVGRQRKGVWKVGIGLAYLVGIIGFYYALPVWSTYPDGDGGVWDRYSH